MPQLLTRQLGEVDYTDDSVFRFPFGLPGFEDERAFVFIRKADTEPIIFMQSLSQPKLCFIMLPILVADPNYCLHLSVEDAAEIGLPTDRLPEIGEDMFCGALICAGDGVAPTANLMSPIVVNLKDRVGAQLIRSDSGYSHQSPLFCSESAACS
jgi:flagellar assembly factor FliW